MAKASKPGLTTALKIAPEPAEDAAPAAVADSPAAVAAVADPHEQEDDERDERDDHCAKRIIQRLAANQEVLPRNYDRMMVPKHLAKVVDVKDMRRLLRVYRDEARIAKEVNACRQRAKFVAIRGTREELAAAAQHVIATAQRRDAELPALDAQIAELQAQRGKLVDDATAAAADVARRQAAAEELRKYAPEELRQSIARECEGIRGHHAQRIGELERQIAQAERLDAIDITDLQGYEQALLAARQLFRDLVREERYVSKNGDGHTSYELDTSRWKSTIAPLLAKLPAAREELAQRVAERNEALAAARAELDNYDD